MAVTDDAAGGEAADGTARAGRARVLAEQWRRVGRQHLSAGQGCGCGFGGLILQAADFELDIVEFLLRDAARAGATRLADFVVAAAARGPDRASLSALLTAIETAPDDELAGSGGLDFALDRLAATLGSIEASHRGGRFVCT